MITSPALGGTTSNVLAMIALALLFFAGLWLCLAFLGWIKKAPWKGNRTMKKAVEEFRSIVDQASSKFELISESDSSDKPAPDK